jgi:N-acetylglucosamine-6-sulfatase
MKLLAIVALVLAGTVRIADPAPRPSIIFILTDDQRWDSINAHTMPNVMGLEATGVTFSNAFVTASACCPSRASILSGNYPDTTDVWRNTYPHGSWASFDPTATIATALHGAGYRTGLVGKYLNGYDGSVMPPGWDEWHAIVNDQAATAYYGYTTDDDGNLITH